MRTGVRRLARRTAYGKRFATAAIAIAAVAVLTATASSTASVTGATGLPGVSLWAQVGGALPATLDGAEPDVQPDKLKAFTLDASGLHGLLDAAPAPKAAAGLAAPSIATESNDATDDSPSGDGQIVSLPDPNGDFQRFELAPSQIMAPGLAALHPDIHTWGGRGIDDPTATIHADLSPLGFHASVRSSNGRLVHRPVLPPRRQRLRELLRPRPDRRTRTACSSSATPTRPSSRSTRATTTRPTRSLSTAAASPRTPRSRSRSPTPRACSPPAR